MSLRRLCITIAAAVLAVGAAACSGDDTETVTVQAPSGDAEGTSMTRPLAPLANVMAWSRKRTPAVIVVMIVTSG